MARITADSIDEPVAVVSPAATRQAELDALAAANKANAAKTIAELQTMGIGGAPKVDVRAALAKLTGGQTLTDDEKRALGMSVVSTPTPIPTATETKDPLRNKDVMPTAPEGYEYKWIGSSTNGSWTLYKKTTTGKSSTPAVTPTPSNVPTTAEVTLVSTETDKYGNVIGIFSDGSTKILIQSGNKYTSTVDEDAYAILKKTFADYGLDDPDILKAIQGYMERGLGSEQAGLELRKTTAYITRFKGNEIRRAANLNVLSEAEYLALEDSYNETLRSYGLQGYFGTDRKVATAAMADIIGNDISAVEFKDRIDTVVTRVNNADPNIKATLKGFYNITDTDLVKYFLNPKEALPILKQKVTAAEIGSEFIKQGLVTGLTSAEEYAKLGIDKATAAKGAETIAAIMPETTKLSQIYAEEGINYSQLTAEEEILKNLDSARRKRLKLAEKAVGSFSGASGLSQGALRSQSRGQI